MFEMENALSKMRTKYLEGKLESIENRLEGMLKDISNIIKDERHTPDQKAKDVVHTIMWGIANMDFSGLMQATNEYSNATGAMELIERMKKKEQQD